MFKLLVALTSDGTWMQFAATADRLFQAKMKALGLDWMFDDDRWQGLPALDDPELRLELWTRMLESANTKSLAEWEDIFDADPNVFAEQYRRGSEVLSHPQLLHDGAVVELSDAERGPVRQPGPIVKAAATPADTARSAPRLDEHHDQIVADAARRGGHRRDRADRRAGRRTAAGRDHDPRAGDAVRGTFRGDVAHRPRRPGDQDRDVHRRPGPHHAAVPGGRRCPRDAGQGEHLHRSLDGRGQGAGVRVCVDGRRRAAGLPGRRRRATRPRRRVGPRHQRRRRLRQRAGLRRRRAVRPQAGLRAEHRRRRRSSARQPRRRRPVGQGPDDRRDPQRRPPHLGRRHDGERPGRRPGRGRRGDRHHVRPGRT